MSVSDFIIGGRFHETPRNLRIIAGEIVHRPRCELRRIMRRKSSCDASQRFVKSTTGAEVPQPKIPSMILKIFQMKGNTYISKM
jgi:hypothetical protein